MMDVRNLSWGVRGKTILDDVSLRCPAGKVTGLLGPNGSGKSSLLHLMAGLRRPQQGVVLMAGTAVSSMTSRERACRIALLEQHSSTSMPLTARQVVALGRTPHRGRFGSPDEGAEAIAAAMRRAKVTSLASQSWQTLSGGERQRVQLARSLAQQPQVLMLDEPTNHLDLSHQIDLLATVRGLGHTVVAALHDLDLAAAFCDHLVVLRGGRVAASGPPEQVLTEELLREVYGVAATVGHHPDSGRVHVIWRDPRVRTRPMDPNGPLPDQVDRADVECATGPG